MALSSNKEKKERQLANLIKIKPGQVLNPTGRPKRLPITEALQKILDDPDNAREYVLAAVKHAKRGSSAHFKEINDRVEGRPVEHVEHTGLDGGPVEHTITFVNKKKSDAS